MSPNRFTADPLVVFDAFLLDAKSRNLSPSTREFFRFHVGPFIEYLQHVGCEDLIQLTPTHIRAYLVHLQEKQLASASQHAAARALRAWLNCAVDDEWIDKSPMDKVRMSKVEKKIFPRVHLI